MTNTHLKYLNDTYADRDTATVLRTGQDERGIYLVLDQTIFYPQGGGQPTDTGVIQTEKTIMNVTFVGFSDGEVLHYIAEKPDQLDALEGQRCALQVDKQRRLHHAKLHTAGHVIAGIIDARRGSMRAIKGFHFDDGPYVEFEGKPEDATDTFLTTLQAQIDSLISENPAVTAALLTYDELKQRCWNVPPNMPEDKPLRTVTIGQLDASPCGGTHIASLAEIESISLLKIKSKKGNTKISYRVGSNA